MEPTHAIAIAGLAFLLTGGVLLISSVRRGRELCRVLAERHPELYAELGAPRPGYFDSVRRTAYFQFIMQSPFHQLGDPYLIEELARLRRSEMRQLGFLIFGFSALGLAFVWLRFRHAA